VLRSIEHRIESLFEGVFGRAFRSHVQPVELARKLAKEMDEAKTVSVSRVYVPNEYHLYLSPKDREQFRGYEDGLLHELSDYLADHARREGYALVSRPRVELHEDVDLSVGEFGIAARLTQAPPQARAEPAAPPVPPPTLAIPDVSSLAQESSSPPPGGTRAYGPAEVEPEAVAAAAAAAAAALAGAEVDDDTPAPVVEPDPERAALVLAGTRHEVERPVLTLGRARECDIVVDDPSVSRRHAELRRGPGGFTLVDLSSTNGTQVNGKKIGQAEVADGDRIMLGQTELRFERF
jgi:Protein of unknown function (DUF3662)/FHA domain